MKFSNYIKQQFLYRNVNIGHNVKYLCETICPLLYGFRGKIAIHNIQKTIIQLSFASKILYKITIMGGRILLVGKQNYHGWIIRLTGLLVKQYFIADNWIPGLISNFRRIRNREKLRGSFRRFLSKCLFYMFRVPSIVISFSASGKNKGCIVEAIVVKLPVIAITDSDINPEDIFLPIPASDDSSLAMYLYIRLVRVILLKAKRQEKIVLKQFFSTCLYNYTARSNNSKNISLQNIKWQLNATARIRGLGKRKNWGNRVWLVYDSIKHEWVLMTGWKISKQKHTKEFYTHPILYRNPKAPYRFEWWRYWKTHVKYHQQFFTREEMLKKQYNYLKYKKMDKMFKDQICKIL